MKKVLIDALGVSLLLVLSLLPWRILFPATDWAAIFLVPLAVLLFLGSRWIDTGVQLASMKAAVRGESPLAWLMTGRLRALLGATVLTLVAVPLLAWHASSSTSHELLLLMLLCLVAAVLFAYAERALMIHLTPPFAKSIAVSAASLIVAVLFVPILAWSNWNFTPQPEAIRGTDLQEALALGFAQLPARRGWVSELLSPLYALEYGKLWFVVQAQSPSWLSVWYSVDAALVGFVAARASAVLMSIVPLLPWGTPISQRLPPGPKQGKSGRPQNVSPASRFFWATVILLSAATIGLTVVGGLPSRNTPSTASVEFPRTTLENLLSDAAVAARDAVEPDIDALLDAVYEPAYAAIPTYAAFHYSVLGEYFELTEAVRGQMSDGLNERLLGGFDQRLADAASDLDRRYVEQYRKILQGKMLAQLSTEGLALPLGEVTHAITQDAIDRARTTLPLATAAAGIVGSGSAEAVSAAVAEKLVARIAAKASAKGLARGGGVLTGAGGGALLCSWSGPGAALCGILGGASAWVLTDAAVVNIDEYFNREEFEAELRAILDDDRAERRALMTAALEAKAVAMDAAIDEVFMMRDLSSDS